MSAYEDRMRDYDRRDDYGDDRREDRYERSDRDERPRLGTNEH